MKKYLRLKKIAIIFAAWKTYSSKTTTKCSTKQWN